MTEKSQEKPRVLIVDDMAENIRILMELLKGEYTILAATSGEAALRIVAGDPLPDLILMDIMMPGGMDGYELCRALKADERTKPVPVMFITAVSEAMDEAKGFELGAVDYVTKPFNPATVKARVKTHIELNTTLTKLRRALRDIRTLTGLLPICSSCKKVRDDKGYWSQIEMFLRDHAEVEFSHSICPDCAKELYPDFITESR